MNLTFEQLAQLLQNGYDAPPASRIYIEEETRVTSSLCIDVVDLIADVVDLIADDSMNPESLLMEAEFQAFVSKYQRSIRVEQTTTVTRRIVRK